MKKILFTLLCIVIFAFLFGVSAFAAELTVGGENSQYATVKEAEAAAQNGDTIIIEADITSDINLTQNKSLELVLKGSLLGGFRVSYSTLNEVTLTIRTEGEGNRTVNFSKKL